jgi:hypothetical protein
LVSFHHVFPPNTVHAFPLSHPSYTPRPYHFSRFYHAHNSGRNVQIMNTSLWSFLHSPVTSSLFGLNILLNILFSNTLNLRSSLNISDQVSHSYKTTDSL